MGDRELSEVTVLPNMSYRGINILSPSLAATDPDNDSIDNGSYDTLVDNSLSIRQSTTPATLPKSGIFSPTRANDNSRSRGLSESYVPCTPPLNIRPPPDTDRSRGLSESYVSFTPPLMHQNKAHLPIPLHDVTESDEKEDEYYNLPQFSAGSLPSLQTMSTSPALAVNNKGVDTEDTMPAIMPYFARITIKPYPGDETAAKTIY